MMRSWCTAALLLLLAPGDAFCDTVDLDSLECIEVERSRVIRRICYDEFSRTMIVDLAGNYRRFCGVDRAAAEGFLHAPSMARYFSQIRRTYRCPGRAQPH